MGLGAACTIGDKSYYYICGCENPYTSSCSNSRPLNSTDYCINLSKGGERNYNGCYQCETSATANYSLNEWWDSICSGVFRCSSNYQVYEGDLREFSQYEEHVGLLDESNLYEQAETEYEDMPDRGLEFEF
jgi:hypothetical protein